MSMEMEVWMLESLKLCSATADCDSALDVNRCTVNDRLDALKYHCSAPV